MSEIWIQVGDDPEPILSGPGASIPAIGESARRVYKRNRDALRGLNERLLIEGSEHNICIEDLERLAQFGKRPAFMRAIMIELMICLRKEPHA